MTEQTKAQRLADEFDATKSYLGSRAAAELRRLDALNAELVEALGNVLTFDAYREVDGYAAHDDAAEVLAKAKEQT